MKRLSVISLVVQTAVLTSALAFGWHVRAQDVVATPLSVMHPLIGNWRVQASQGCFEVYELRADGTKSTKSKDERNDAVFEISATPDGSGFYKWIDKIVASNLRPDCNGQTATIGHVATSYVRVHRDRSRFLLCREPRQKTCFAEFMRTEERVR